MTTTHPEKHTAAGDAEKRTAYWDAPPGEPEDRFSTVLQRTVEFCVRCGRQGTWADEGIDNPEHRLCQHCGTLVRFNTQPELVSDFWAEILQQIRA